MTDFKVKLFVEELNQLRIILDYQYRVQDYHCSVYCDEQLVGEYDSGYGNEIGYMMSKSGTYQVKVRLEDGSEAVSDSLKYNADEAFSILKDGKKKTSLLNRVVFTAKELIENRTMMSRIALFDYKLESQDTYLGRLWAILTPLTQIGVFWLVFGIGLRQGKDVDGFPYLVWMLCGLVPWFYISAGVMSGANSIYAKSGTVTRMRFPISIVPVSRILQETYSLGAMLLILVTVLFAHGVFPSLSWLNLIYYGIYAFAFLTCLALVTSVLCMLARDFYKLLSSIIRLLFYVTPILWTMDNMPAIFQMLMEYNPIYYVVKGFRESLMYGIPFYENWQMILIMWVMNGVVFVLGCSLQAKFKNKFIDML